MNKTKSILAVFFAFSASVATASAGAQTTGATPGQPTSGETYRPVLNATTTSAPAPAIDMRPMTQEEKTTGRQEPSRLKEIDPATHPAPQNVRPVLTPQPNAPRTAQQQIDSSARMPTPSAPVMPSAPNPAPAGPTSSQVNSCVGATCTDASGATINSSVGNSTVNSQGRLCNRTGNTMQCF